MSAADLLRQVDDLKEQRGWKDAELSRRAGLSKSRISLWRSGKEPTADTVLAVARILRMDVVDALALAGLLTQEEIAPRQRMVMVEGPADLALIGLVRDRLAWIQSELEAIARSQHPSPAMGIGAHPLADEADAVAETLLRDDRHGSRT